MKNAKKIIAVLAAVSALSIGTVNITANAIEIPQKLIEINIYTDSEGYIVNEYIWEDMNGGIMPLESLSDATWVGVSDKNAIGRHRSAKEYGYQGEHYGWRAAAQTELQDANTLADKYHYTRARIVGPGDLIGIEDVRDDSGRVWGTGKTTARTTGDVVPSHDDFGIFLRSYWGY